MRNCTYFDGWMNGERVQVMDWIKQGEIYINIQRFRPGSSINNPLTDKTFIVILDHPELLRSYLHSIVLSLSCMDERRDANMHLIPFRIFLPAIRAQNYLQEAM